MDINFVRTIKSCDVNKYFDLLNDYPYAITRFSIKENGKELFFQKALDGDVSMETFFKGEEAILTLCNEIYKKDKYHAAVSYFTANTCVISNSYAKKTWDLKTRIVLNLMSLKCIKVSSIHVLNMITKVGCRDIGSCFLYFSSEDVFVCVDALRCVVFSKTREQALGYIEKTKFRYTVEMIDNK